MRCESCGTPLEFEPGESIGYCPETEWCRACERTFHPRDVKVHRGTDADGGHRCLGCHRWYCSECERHHFSVCAMLFDLDAALKAEAEEWRRNDSD